MFLTFGTQILPGAPARPPGLVSHRSRKGRVCATHPALGSAPHPSVRSPKARGPSPRSAPADPLPEAYTIERTCGPESPWPNETHELERPAQATYESPRQPSEGPALRPSVRERLAGAEGGTVVPGGAAPSRPNPKHFQDLQTPRQRRPAPAQGSPVRSLPDPSCPKYKP